MNSIENENATEWHKWSTDFLLFFISFGWKFESISIREYPHVWLYVINRTTFKYRKLSRKKQICLLRMVKEWPYPYIRVLYKRSRHPSPGRPNWRHNLYVFAFNVMIKCWPPETLTECVFAYSTCDKLH